MTTTRENDVLALGRFMALTYHLSALDGRVHAVNPQHQHSLWLGPTYYCGLGMSESDSSTLDMPTCGSCARAYISDQPH